MDGSEDEGYGLVQRLTFRYFDVNGWTGGKSKCYQEEEQTACKMRGVVPGGRDVGRLGDGGAECDRGGDCAAESGYYHLMGVGFVPL